MAKSEPIIQISPVEFLSGDREDMPEWLKDFNGGDFDARRLLESRVVFNPGAGTEGSPIRIFNQAHAAHVFLYVDYDYTASRINAEMSTDAFLGYHILYEKRLNVRELLRQKPRYHLTAEEIETATEMYEHYGISTKNSFGILKIYQRDEGYGEEHGAYRFALLYIGGDAIATYDALFGNTSCTPYACVVDAYSCNAYTPFGKDSILEKVAIRSGRLPKYLLCARHCQGWNGYEMRRDVSGSRYRFIWERT